MSFNPRSREGNDKAFAIFGCTDWCFNPRSREGNDSCFYVVWELHTGFNPRSREGNDDWTPDTAPSLFAVSIHVPARGTTISAYQKAGYIPGFNPRSREGNDRCSPRSPASPEVSIHVPARGTTRLSSLSLMI